jgi:putative zinc finger/helix-turn-helix YgiT family protein
VDDVIHGLERNDWTLARIEWNEAHQRYSYRVSTVDIEGDGLIVLCRGASAAKEDRNTFGMVNEHIHDLEERKATSGCPYHFVGSGLPNVYLIGIKYNACKTCNAQSADIPAIQKLMQLIARTIVENEAALTGLEIRFLRKRLGKKSSDFASLVGVSAEQVSRWENGHNPPERSADKLIRIFYSILSRDRTLRQKMNRDIEDWLTTMTADGQVPDIRAKLQNKEWKAETVPA